MAYSKNSSFVLAILSKAPFPKKKIIISKSPKQKLKNTPWARISFESLFFPAPKNCPTTIETPFDEMISRVVREAWVEFDAPTASTHSSLYLVH